MEGTPPNPPSYHHIRVHNTRNITSASERMFISAGRPGDRYCQACDARFEALQVGSAHQPAREYARCSTACLVCSGRKEPYGVTDLGTHESNGYRRSAPKEKDSHTIARPRGSATVEWTTRSFYFRPACVFRVFASASGRWLPLGIRWLTPFSRDHGHRGPPQATVFRETALVRILKALVKQPLTNAWRKP